MPNRLLKESICCSENIDRLTPFQETFFYRLIVNCDDYGRMDARPKVLASKLFPLKDVRLNQINDALRALTSAELVDLYAKDGHPFLQMKTWDRHQQIRAKKSKYPAPDINCNQLQSNDINCNHMISNDIKCNQMISNVPVIQSNPIRIQSESESNARPRARETVADESFDLFWSKYPNRVAKQDAFKAWNKIKPDDDLLKRIMEGLDRWIGSDEWHREDGRFIPHPATWLNGKRWEDDVRKHKASAKTVPAQDFQQRDYSDVQSELEDQLARDMEEFIRNER